MCHLFAFSSSTGRTLEPFAADLAPFSETESPDGWGMAAEVAGGTTLVKEPVSFATARSRGGPAVARALRTPATTLLFHLREKSVGARSVENCHPFRRRFMGRTFLFMHNGTVPEARKKTLRSLEPSGTTDSEHAFLSLLESMPAVPADSLQGWLKGECDRFRALGKFNCVLAEGDMLWAYADNALHYAERKDAAERRGFAHARRGVSSIAPPRGSRAIASAPGARGGPVPRSAAPTRMLLVATCPFLDADHWRPLPPGSLLVARAGRVLQIVA